MIDKPKYGTPVVMRLGEVSRGAGWCTDGTGNVSEWCGVGTNAAAWGCLTGPGAVGFWCLDGDSATNGCWAGGAVVLP